MSVDLRFVVRRTIGVLTLASIGPVGFGSLSLISGQGFLLGVVLGALANLTMGALFAVFAILWWAFIE